ncbi:MAG: hypothetical protein EXQ50_02535 [Acidobacteria bacterium]|nr:hypothetical protein [Acidobacteriota bacterium]MSO83406.1 hypothetical protein [Acidobacteriota bacterium]
MRRVWMMLWVLALAAPAAAQPSERLPWFSVDLHGAWVGLPTAEGWVPVVTATTPLPGRAWGVAGGATVYPVKLGVMTLGLGVAMHTGKSTSSALTSTTGTGSAEVTKPTTTTVTTQITSLLPQLSINFGHKLGWSYLSAGYGRSKAASSAAAFGTAVAQTVPEAWNVAINFGGGAKWFMKPHLGAGFDVRFTKLGSRGATAALPSARRTQMVTISVGISIQ